MHAPRLRVRDLSLGQRGHLSYRIALHPNPTHSLHYGLRVTATRPISDRREWYASAAWRRWMIGASLTLRRVGVGGTLAADHNNGRAELLLGPITLVMGWWAKGALYTEPVAAASPLVPTP